MARTCDRLIVERTVDGWYWSYQRSNGRRIAQSTSPTTTVARAVGQARHTTGLVAADLQHLETVAGEIVVYAIPGRA